MLRTSGYSFTLFYFYKDGGQCITLLFLGLGFLPLDMATEEMKCLYPTTCFLQRGGCRMVGSQEHDDIKVL